MLNEQPTIRAADLLLDLALGIAAVLAVLPPWCGLGWGPSFEWLCAATAGLVIAVRFVWSR